MKTPESVQSATGDSTQVEAGSMLDTLLESVPDFIYFKDRESRFVRFSRNFLTFLNTTDPNTLKGKTDFDLFAEEHARQAYEDEQRIIQTGEPIIGKLEKELHRDGHVTWALTTKMPWRDKEGNIIGTFGISRDVTEVKMAEARLANERELFQTLLEKVPDAIYFKDIDSHFVRLSNAKVQRSMLTLQNQFRATHSAEEPLPSYLTNVDECARYLEGKTDYDLCPEEQAREFYEEEMRIIRTGEAIASKIVELVMPDGKTGWFYATKMPWRDEKGQIIGTFGISRDITAIKEAEARLENTHQRLIETSRLAGMAEIATDVLHNVGNVLNSVNVSCSLMMDRVKKSKIASLGKVSALLTENRERLGEFWSQDPRGQQIPDYLIALNGHLNGEQNLLLTELEQLLKHVDHIKQIVAMQQSYAKVAGVLESISPNQLVDDALEINAAALVRHDVKVSKEVEKTPQILTERHKVLQILVNLIRNAKYALDDAKRTDKLMTVKVTNTEKGGVKIQVIDNGVGIPPENLVRIFSHGFTTRRNGHGFGLHSSVLAAKELGGSLDVHSDGVGKGAVFTLSLPDAPPAKLAPAIS